MGESGSPMGVAGRAGNLRSLEINCIPEFIRIEHENFLAPHNRK
jgi:hypothetical protein